MSSEDAEVVAAGSVVNDDPGHLSGRIKPTDFHGVVAEAFAFLSAYGFTAPIDDSSPTASTVSFASERLSVTVYYTDHYGEIETVLSAGDSLRGSVTCVYVEADLGHAQAIGHIARSQHSLRKSVVSQAEALRAILDEVPVDQLPTFLGRCVGR